MKSSVKREKKKYPYHRNKYGIFTQIHAHNQRIKEKLPNWAIVDERGEIIEKFRLQNAAQTFINQNQKDYFNQLRIVKLDENGNVPK